MTNKEMDVKIRNAFEAATPNVLGSVLAQCAKQKRNVTVFKPRRTTGWTLRFVTATAAAVLVLVLATGLLPKLPPIIPTGPLYTGTDPTTGPTDPHPTDSVPTDPEPTNPEPTDPIPTDPEPTDPEPTDPKPIDPSGFPDDLITDEKVLEMFREMFTYTYPEQNFFNMALLSFYDNPHEVGLEDLFYNGFAGQRPITSAEMAELRNKGFNVELDIQRLTKKQIDDVLREVFGLWEAAVDAELGRQLTYLESTDCFYTNHTDGNLAANFQPVGIQVYPNCTRVYYVYNDDTKGVVTMYKYGAAWRIHSNHILGTEPAINTVFPEGLDSSDATLEKFQTMFSFGSWNSQALCCSYSDPRDLELYNFFYGLKFEDEPPLTQAERDAIVAMSGYEDYSWLDGARFPVEKMDAKLQEMFGVSLNEMHNNAFSLMYYLENTNSYYYFNGGFSHVDFLRIIGTKTLENGYVQVYYGVGFGYHLDYLDQGVVTLKPVGNGYHILSNYYSEDGTWPEEEPPKPTDPWLMIPDQFPDDLITDEANLAVFQSLFDTNDWYRHALCLGYDDPRQMSLHSFFYGSGIVYERGISDAERADLVEKTGLNAFSDSKVYRLSAKNMDKVLKEIYGISLDEVHEGCYFGLYYLESTGCYYYYLTNTVPISKVYVLGTRILENGDTEVYYSYRTWFADWPIDYGCLTLRSIGNGYQVVSHRDVPIWPIPGQDLEIPEGAPADLNTDPEVVLKYQRLFYDDSWYTQALFMEFNDPRNIRLKDFLFDSCKPWPFKHFTDDEERKELFEELGIGDSWYDWTGIEASTVEQILRTVFGLSLDEFTDTAKQGYYYLESTDSYYYGWMWSNSVAHVTVAGVRELENGNVEVYYTTKTGLSKGFVTLKPVGDSYIVVANTDLEK